MSAVDPTRPEEVQQRIAHYRKQLLAGRGPGAGQQETAPYMRDRKWLGGVPSPVARQREADQAALAREDLSAISDVVIRRRSDLAAALARLTERLQAMRTRAVAGLRGALISAAVVAVGLAVRTALHRLNGDRVLPRPRRE